MTKETLDPSASPLRVNGKFFREGDDGPIHFVKAVTFGPFPPNTFVGDEVRQELEKIKFDLGANAIRFYEPPLERWLDECLDLGLKVFISIPWSQHMDFINDKPTRRETKIRVRDVVNRYRRHDAVVAYYIGNEIPATMVRFLGPDRVTTFLEELIEIGRDCDPNVLFSYANYPSTEFLIPANQDFLAFNIYLEDEANFGKYLDRLQNIAGNWPVMVSEFGIDSKEHGQRQQAEVLDWHIGKVCEGGLAGTTIFAWSDHWFRGGEIVDGWNFGLTDREGKVKDAHTQLALRWKDIDTPIDGVELTYQPRFSIIICTYKGTRLLDETLRTAEALDYPDYEIIVVNDSNDSAVREIVEQYEKVRHVGIPHGGLSRARNVGAKTANGDIFVYTDDDCRLEPDWLSWLAYAFTSEDKPACVGGPNIPPPPESAEEAIVIACPGGPAHVLVGNRKAEHVPGCNIAVKRVAFEAIGGFDEQFRTAGDDVDFCWRLLEADFKIGFHAAAFVWHHRRATYATYLKQQKGYGKAEAMLKAIHFEKFSYLGGATWAGSVYEGPILSFNRSSGKVYHGRHGYEPFQLIYPDTKMGMSSIFSHLGYFMIAGTFLALGFVVHPAFWIVTSVLLLISFISISLAGSQAGLDRNYESSAARLRIGWLIFRQGITRSGTRMIQAITYNRPLSFIWQLGKILLSLPRFQLSNSLTLNFWDDNDRGRDELLGEIETISSSVREDPTGAYDYRFRPGLFFKPQLITVTEYHDRGFRATRARINYPLRTGLFIALTLVAGIFPIFFQSPLWILLIPMGVALLEWLGTAISTSNLVRAAAEKAKLEFFKGSLPGE